MTKEQSEDTIKEFKRGLRDHLKNVAYSGFRKNIKDLTECEMKIALDKILIFDLPLWKQENYGTINKYKDVFRETFSKELVLAKKCKRKIT